MNRFACLWEEHKVWAHRAADWHCVQAKAYCAGAPQPLYRGALCEGSLGSRGAGAERTVLTVTAL